MASIKRHILLDLQNEARNYMKFLKGDKVTDDDIIIAENLMVFGYSRGLDEGKKIKEISMAVKENRAIINSDCNYGGKK
jgi:uncharacterized Zn ribbon protein